MAAREMNDLMDFIKDSEYGHFPDSGPSKRTLSARSRMAAARDIIGADADAVPPDLLRRIALEVDDGI